MTSGSRRSRNYKEKRPMLAFGQIILPIAALIAVGLLFVGIKLFFLTPPDRGGVEVVAGAEPVREANNLEEKSTDVASAVVPVKSEEKKPQPKQNVVLAGPVDPTKPAKKESKPAATKPSAVKPSAPAAAKPASTAGSTKSEKPAQVAVKPNTKIETKPTAKPTSTQTTKKPETAPAQTSTVGKWAVQIGAFTKEEGAKTLSAQAKNDGYATTISAADSSSGTKFYRVRVSAGDSKEKAEKLAAELEKKGYPVSVLPVR